MRTFVALEIPDWYADEVAEFTRSFGPTVEGRFTPRENYHVTLAFLGNTPEAVARQVMDAMDELARIATPATLTPEGLGTFGRPHDCTLWLGFQRTDELDDLAHDLRERLDVRGIPFDRKPFAPHLTLARRVQLPEGALPATGFPGRCRTARVTLYKSTLQPEGAAYQPLYTVELPDLPR